MSRGIICDNCGEALAVNEHGDDANGETGAWLQIRTVFAAFDACSRSCAVALIESDAFVAAHDDMTQSIAEIAGTIRRAGDEDEDQP